MLSLNLCPPTSSASRPPHPKSSHPRTFCLVRGKTRFSFESLGLLTMLLSNLELHPPTLAVRVYHYTSFKIQGLGPCMCCVLSQVLSQGPFKVTVKFSTVSLRLTVLVLGAGFWLFRASFLGRAPTDTFETKAHLKPL